MGTVQPRQMYCNGGKCIVSVLLEHCDSCFWLFSCVKNLKATTVKSINMLTVAPGNYMEKLKFPEIS